MQKSGISRARRIVEELGINDISDAEELPGAAAWCNYSDPWGNKLGLFEDLQKVSKKKIISFTK